MSVGYAANFEASTQGLSPDRLAEDGLIGVLS